MKYGNPPSLEFLMARLGVDPAAAQGGVASIGSIGSANVSLAVALDRCRSAEASLDSAREAARAAARREGKGTGALFSKSRYVARDSATRWCDESRHEGFDAGFQMCCKHFEKAFNRDPNDPTNIMADALARHGFFKKGGPASQLIGGGAARLSEVDAIQARILKSREVDLSSNALIGAPTTSAELVSAIHAAAAKARTRTGGHPDDKPPMNALSEAIVEAGKKRRGDL